MLAVAIVLSLIAQAAAPADPPPGARIWTTADFPRGDAAGHGREVEYPASALRAGQEGRTRVALRVGVDGLPAACWVVESSGVADLDTATCRAMFLRARFTPKRDAAGKAVEEVVTVPVTWRLPE